jgi:hypothetical protein
MILEQETVPQRFVILFTVSSISLHEIPRLQNALPGNREERTRGHHRANDIGILNPSCDAEENARVELWESQKRILALMLDE